MNDLKAYQDAFDAQPWATDEPARVQLDRITQQLETNRARAEEIIAAREAAITRLHAKIEALTLALKDAISTYDPDREITIVTAERQEAWNEALKL